MKTGAEDRHFLSILGISGREGFDWPVAVMFKKSGLYKLSLFILVLLLTGLVFGTLTAGAAPDKPTAVSTNLGLEGKLGQAVAKAPAGTAVGQIDPNAPQGFLGIPGAPKVARSWLSCGPCGWAGYSPL